MDGYIESSILRKITNNFSVSSRIGGGGYGDVYQGEYRGKTIAVKLFRQMEGIDDDQFINELGNHKKVQHPNIVQLVGYCNIEDKRYYEPNSAVGPVLGSRIYRVLCFEYMEGGSLEKRLSTTCAEDSLGNNWPTHYKIIKGICQGLCYLHQALILHLDLRPANILLDKDMTPKIADFGLSRIFTGSHSHVILKKVVGTRKYMPPELIGLGEASEKTDIFSLGVTIIDIMAGPEMYINFPDMDATEFANKVLTYWTNRNMTAYLYEVKRCVEIAIECLHPARDKRPTVREILRNLNNMETEAPSMTQFKQDEGSSSTHTKNYFLATGPMAITFNELHRITDGFSEKRLLGTGGYGKVYKGVLYSGEVIAVKKLYSHPELVEAVFQNELLNLMSIQHQNIIRLVGYSSETKDIVVNHEGKLVFAAEQQRALCLEYMHGGNLDKHLSDESHGLDWEARYKIIRGICQGLKHLHTGSEYPIYHLDLKPANILLDNDGTPKIGDFGLSRLRDSAQTFVTKTFRGTRGYIPPEYIDGLLISPKYDVYSLGVIIIQVIAGREGYSKCGDMTSQEFIDLVTENWCKRVQEKQMLSEDELYQVEKCIEIGLRCVEAKRVNRPTITQIVEELDLIS